ncbi:MAG: nucleotidyltransferase domain-containing protein [Spirochaetota bacterium]
MVDQSLSSKRDAELKAMGRAFARRARRAAAERDRQIAARQEAARVQIEDLVRRFRSEDPHIRRIILFGSLAAGTPRNPHFDIDLAVDSDRYWELLGIALDQPIPVDLADLPRTSSHIRNRILAEGTVLYER